MSEDNRPDINLASGNAAWAAVQAICFELVRTGIIDKERMREMLQTGVEYHQKAPGLGNDQRGAAPLLSALADMLQTADRRNSN